MSATSTPIRPLKFGLYEQACVGLSYGSTVLWRDHTDDRLESTGFPFWLNLARVAEESNLDLLFFGDVLGMTDVYQDSAAIAIETGKELPAHDPLSIVPAILATTSRLGVAVTASTTYEHPFSHARRFSTLDHLSEGRIGWNVVTSYLPNAAANFGLDKMLEHDSRYDRADEFLDVAYKLWEGSWADDAYVGDKASGLFARADRVRTIDHVGDAYRVKGPHLSHPSPQRTPVLFQAGWSPRGKRFAAKHAEVVFAGSQSAESMREGAADIRRQAVANGRDTDELSFLGAFSLVTARTAIEVQEKYDRLQDIHDSGFEARVAAFAGWTGVDLSKYADHEPINRSSTDHTQSGVSDRAARAGGVPTAGQVRESMRSLAGDNPTVFIGTPDDVADRITAYAGDSGVDGLVLRSYLSPGSLEEFAEHIVPRLIKRGVYREDAPQGTLRENFGSGARAHASHPAAGYRW
ncbi:NtaA/DmoA family FMN-dependent monooxygenase [Plantibacter flavus]|uniref:NtaA/DmoA family FMN-dependent monooxygenase n=1 Tax=Plantibacter flavus TaxID=150123 RepID=UPI003F14F2C0